jgi:hypothetical protein
MIIARSLRGCGTTLFEHHAAPRDDLGFDHS